MEDVCIDTFNQKLAERVAIKTDVVWADQREELTTAVVVKVFASGLFGCVALGTIATFLGAFQ